MTGSFCEREVAKELNRDQARPQPTRLHVCRRSLKSTRRSVVPVAFAVGRARTSNWLNRVHESQSPTGACARLANVVLPLHSANDKLVHFRAGYKRGSHQPPLYRPTACKHEFHSLLPFFPEAIEVKRTGSLVGRKSAITNGQSRDDFCGRML